MGAPTIPEDAPRQARYCPTCGHTAVHWGLWTTIERMVEERDMRPSGGVGEWTCAECGRHEDVIESNGRERQHSIGPGGGEAATELVDRKSVV